MIKKVQYRTKASKQRGLSVFYANVNTCEYLDNKDYYSVNKYKNPKASRWWYMYKH